MPVVGSSGVGAPEQIAWVDADGVVTPLTGNADLDVMRGPQGRYMPPVELIDQEVPLQPGSRLRRVKVKAREVTLPFEVWATTDLALLARLRSLVAAFDPVRGDGRLRVTAHDGAQRELTCRYAGGLEIDESGDNAWDQFQRMAAVFKAFDPYWYDLATLIETFTTGATPATFFPFFPLRLSSSEIFADATIINLGDVEAWPVWTIAGPGSGLIIRNLTTGKELALDRTLTDGESVVIDTGAKSVRGGDGSNLFADLTTGYALWPLERGANLIRIEIASSTVDTVVQLAYRHRYLTP